MIKVYQKEGAMNVSEAAGTDMYLIDAPVAGTINVKECFGVLTEATGTMTADGTVLLKVAGNTVGTITLTDDAAVGASFRFAVDGTYATDANPYVEFAAADDILVEIGTQATGVATGDGDVFLGIDFGF